LVAKKAAVRGHADYAADYGLWKPISASMLATFAGAEKPTSIFLGQAADDTQTTICPRS
jgi:hypothetical protein